MIYLVGKMGATQFQECQPWASGMLLTPRSWLLPPPIYAVDNGAFAHWYNYRRNWDDGLHDEWLKAIAKVQKLHKPLWVLAPDVVMDSRRTLELASIYAPILHKAELPVAIALQEGVEYNSVLEFQPQWVFIGGSTEWKLEQIVPVCRYFSERNIRVHVGRVNTAKRLKLCMGAGADAADGTSLNRYRSSTLPLFAKVLSAPRLPLP